MVARRGENGDGDGGGNFFGGLRVFDFVIAGDGNEVAGCDDELCAAARCCFVD